MSHYQEIADLQLANTPGEQLRQQRRILDAVYGSPYDTVQAAAARRRVLDLTRTAPEAIARTVVAAVHGDARAAYAWLDNLNRAVNHELRRTNQKGT